MSYTIESNLGELLDNEQTKAVLELHLPGISNHPSIGMGRSMPLKTVAGFSGGMITDAHLAKIAEDFAKLA